MHEFALADAVLRAVIQTAEDEDLARIDAVLVRVGELQQIQQDVFEFALSEVRPVEDERLCSTVVTVEIEPASFRCRACEREFSLAEAAGERGEADLEAIHFVPELSHAFLRCPACNSPDFEITAGRGVSIASIEGIRIGFDA